MIDYETVTAAVYDDATDTTALTISGGGMTPAEHKGRIVTFLDGAPERDRVATGNTATVVTVRGDASGETGTHVQVQDLQPRIGEYGVRIARLEALGRWAYLHLTRASGEKDAPYADVVSSPNYDAEKDYTTFQLTTGGLGVGAEVGRVLTFTDGEPERSWVIIHNEAASVNVRGDATGEGGTAVRIQEIASAITDLRVSRVEVEALKTWAQANL